MKSRFKSRFLLFGITAILVACGGGGSGGSTGGPSGGGSGGGASGSAYLFYSGLFGFGNSLPGVLFAVDPANPNAPIPVEAGENAIMGTIRTFRTGTYNGATRIATEVHSNALIYAKTDGKFYRIDTLKSGSLTPVRISSESTANTVCTSIAFAARSIVTDLNNFDNSQLVYPFAGSDGNCGTGDDEWKMIRLGMTASDVPIVAKLPLRTVYDPNTGSISGWLVNDSGVLRQCDANFTNCSASIKTIVSNAQNSLDLNFDRVLLQIDNQLFVYDTSTITLSAPLFTIPVGSFTLVPPVTDGDTIFVAYDDSLYSFPADGSATATLLKTEPTNIARLALSTNKVIYQVSNEIKSMLKTGGADSVLVDALSTEILTFDVSGDYIYSSVAQLNFSPPAAPSTQLVQAAIIDENGGSQTTFPNATWAGLNIDISTLDLNQFTGVVFDSMVMILAETVSGSGFSGATIKAFDGATAVEGATLGTLPTTDDIPLFSCRGFEHNMLCGATVNISPVPALPASPSQTDMFFVNSLTANSLARVTNTEDRNEGEIFF